MVRSIGRLLELYRHNDVSCEEVVKDCLEKIRRIGLKSGLNCVAELDDTIDAQISSLNENAAGKNLPLYGVPLLIKDNIDVKGLHTTAGSLAIADVVAEKDAAVVENLRKNGAIILGKANMTEFANFVTQGMPGGYSSRGGQVIHAINPKLSPSGSSSGSAVAVSAGLVPGAIGTDTSFSVIGCAQDNGICGLKPPRGALSSRGIIPIARTLDSAGPMTNSIKDALLLYSAMRDTPYAPALKTRSEGFRIAINQTNRHLVSEEQTACLYKMIPILERSQMTFEDIMDEPTPLQIELMKWEFRPQLEEYLAASNASLKTLEDIVRYYEANPETMMKYGATLLRASLNETTGDLKDPVYQKLLEKRAEAIKEKTSLFSKYDAVIMAGPTNIMHFCGFPSVTVKTPEKNTNGVPQCLIMYGVDEDRLYQTALAMEKLLHA